MSDEWCTIESDPAVFSELIESFGVKDISVNEIYSLDEISSKSYGLIFLFKYCNETDQRPIADDDSTQGLFFAKQIVQNACATQAILSILMNSPEIDLGTLLKDFKEFTYDFDPESKGIAIGNSDVIRQAHNAFARPEVFVSKDEQYSRKGLKSEEVYHFIAYITHGNHVYELDGLKQGPIRLGAVPESVDWMEIARPAIEERMSRYSSSETHFALLSVCQKRETLLMNELQLKREILNATENETERKLIEDEINGIEIELSMEENIRKQQREENVRRKHNYLQFSMGLITILAKRGKLSSLIENAKNKKSNTKSVAAK